MKKVVLLLFVLTITFTGKSQTCRLDTLSYTVRNTNQKLQFSIPLIPGRGYAVQTILVNGNMISKDIQHPMVRINLENSEAKFGDTVLIQVLYIKDYQPVLLNPEDLQCSP